MEHIGSLAHITWTMENLKPSSVILVNKYTQNPGGQVSEHKWLFKYKDSLKSFCSLKNSCEFGILLHNMFVFLLIQSMFSSHIFSKLYPPVTCWCRPLVSCVGRWSLRPQLYNILVSSSVKCSNCLYPIGLLCNQQKNICEGIYYTILILSLEHTALFLQLD